MNSKFRNLLFSSLCGCCLLLLSSAALADSFVPPTGKISPFRRDRLPINDRAINWLSTFLVTLTNGSPYETPEQHREVAKAIALAIALDPENKIAETRLSKLIEGKKPDSIDPEKIEREKKIIWNLLSWLSSPEAGQDGNLLAALIGETLAGMYPADPQLSSYVGKPEHEAWNGWVAELASFKKAPVVEEKPVIEEKEKEKENELASNEPKVEPKITKKPSILLDNAKVSTVIQVFDQEKSLWLPKVVQVDMKGSNDPKNDEGDNFFGFRLDIAGNSDDYWQIQEELTSPLRDQLLEHRENQLPKRAEINIRVDGEQSYPFSKNRNALSGTAFVLANAALTGEVPNGTVLGEIDRSGKLKLPNFLWRSLMTLAESSGGRLIIPASAEPMFINILALEKPEFFFKYEVLVASSLKEFTTLASQEPSPEHKEIYNKFKLIKDKAAGNVIGVYLTNKFVRERLQEIVNQAPYHLSAKVLNLYGSGTRPRYLSREALAAEIWRKVDVVSELVKIHDFYGINSRQLAKLDEIYKKMRDDLKDLERYTDSRNTDLLTEAKDLVSSVRGFGREFEGRGEIWEKYEKIQAARDTMSQSNSALVEKLTKLTGDPPPR